MNPLASAGLTAFILILVGVLVWYFMLRPKNGDKCHPEDEDRVDGATVYTIKDGECTPNACATGFTYDATSNTCTKNTTPEPVIPGTACDSYVGTQAAENALTFKIGSSLSCDQIASCNTEAGYMLINGSCVKDNEPCTPYEWQGASAGTAIVLGGNVGICNPTPPSSIEAEDAASGWTSRNGLVTKYYQFTDPTATDLPENDLTGVEIPTGNSRKMNDKCGLYITPRMRVTNKGYVITTGTSPENAANICATTHCTEDSCKGIVYIDNAPDGKANCFVLNDSEPFDSTTDDPRNGAICLYKNTNTTT